jgi:RNA polymerase sigma factor (sigma-70 family)
VNEKKNKFLETLLYESINNMIYKIIRRFTSTQEDLEDAFQDCYIYLYDKLEKYNSKFGKFTTWTWKVCTNFMNNYSNKKNRKKKKEVLATDFYTSEHVSHFDEREDSREDSLFSENNSNTIKKHLLNIYNENKSEKFGLMFKALFGDVTSEDYVPYCVPLREASETSGLGYTQLCVFRKNKVLSVIQSAINKSY